MRELTLGLEVVLPDGQIWNGLRGLRKDNTGYDLKQLFIGAEGTLGIITAAVLKLYPAIRRRATAWAALVDAESAVALLGTLRGYCGERLSGFELMSRQSLDFVLRHQPGSVDPFDTAYPCYLLVELSDPAAAAALDETLQVALGEGVELGLLQDAVIASSQAQAAALWRLREGISEAQNHEDRASSTISACLSAASRRSSPAPAPGCMRRCPGCGSSATDMSATATCTTT